MVRFNGDQIVLHRNSITVEYPLIKGIGQEKDLFNQVTSYCETHFDRVELCSVQAFCCDESSASATSICKAFRLPSATGWKAPTPWRICCTSAGGPDRTKSAGHCTKKAASTLLGLMR